MLYMLPSENVEILIVVFLVVVIFVLNVCMRKMHNKSNMLNAIPSKLWDNLNE